MSARTRPTILCRWCGEYGPHAGHGLCRRCYAAAYQREHAEAIHARQKRRRLELPAGRTRARIAYCLEWYAAHPEHRAAYAHARNERRSRWHVGMAVLYVGRGLSVSGTIISKHGRGAFVVDVGGGETVTTIAKYLIALGHTSSRPAVVSVIQPKGFKR